MKLYIKAYSSYRSDEEDRDIKQELKQRYKLDVRRQDAFIHLATLGAQRLKECTNIHTDDELYITSGLGNVDILQKVYEYVTIQKQFIRPFDFINILGNTTSYYVASSIGVNNKNIFQISDNFTFIHSLISIYASLYNSTREAVLGSVDLASTPQEVAQKLLGLRDDTKIISSVNYQKLSFNPNDALASVEFDLKIYTGDEINEILNANDTKVIVSNRCRDLNVKQEDFLFETIASNVLNKTIKNKEDVLYIECYAQKYKILKISCLR